MENLDISVVIPLYNEEESLPELVEWIDRVMKENHFSYEVILVDDGSTDDSWKVVHHLQERFPSVKGISFQRNYGKSAALHIGFGQAIGEVVITMDADLQDSPDEIPGLYKMIVEDGYDLVSGYKAKRYDPLSKTIPTKLFNYATRKVSGINNLHDFNCGLKAYKKRVVKNIEIYGEMHRYIPVIAKWAGFKKIGEKVVQHRARKYGTTKFGMNRFINGFLDLISISVISRYMKRPMHFFGFWGVIWTMIGGGFLLYLLFYKIFGFMAEKGMVDINWGGPIGDRVPALFFATICFLLGILFMITGLLGELIARNSPSRNEYRIREYAGFQRNEAISQ